MKNINSKDPMKKEIVIALKKLTGASKVTQVKEDKNAYYGTCMVDGGRGIPYKNLGVFKIDKKSLGKTSEVSAKITEFCKSASKQLSDKPKKIKGKTVEEFIEFLEETLIPDLKESGTVYTAQDFETAVKWIKHFKG